MKKILLFILFAVACGQNKETKTIERIIEKPGGGNGQDLCLNEVAWDNKVKPLTDKNCVGCHSGMAGYDGAVDFMQVAEKGGKNGIRRVFGAAGSVMPPQGSGFSMTEDEKQILQTWLDQGFKKTCAGTGSGEGGYYTFEDAETIMIKFLENQDKTGRENTRFLIGTNNINNPETKISSTQLQGGSSKVVNQLSNERDLVNPVSIGGGIYAIELDDLGFTKDDWRLIEDADPFKLESNTTKGKEIKDLTGARRPWIHLDNFTNVSHSDPTYSKLKRIPNNLNGFLDLVEVDRQENYDEFEAHLIGVQQSEISPEDKDRLLERLEGDEGYCWTTHDNSVNDLNNPATDVIQFPLVDGVGSNRVFLSNATEWICQQKNGMFIFALFNGVGQRVDFAPLDVVVNTKAAGKRLDPTVRNARECTRCHNEGMIAARDQVRNSVGFNFLAAETLSFSREPICIGKSCEIKIDPSKCYDSFGKETKCPDIVVTVPVDQPGICRDKWNNRITCQDKRDPNRCYNDFGHEIKCGTAQAGTIGQLDAKDRELVEIFYKTNDINDTVFKNDNQKYAKKLAEIGVNPVDDDPINVLADNLRVDADINEFCARFFLPVPECRRRIEQSDILRVQLAPLLTDSGVINLSKLIDLTQIIVREMRLFVDRIDQ